ncbi:hypothetical protein [Celeribacter litoreus]|uniref:hypothetical protein n=1 Tax=Celeribacter litoreus TaxID=2876714 RepID=UPI001CCC3A76|nr:hypothetical protein [Celeribacter litoreus]MCA0042283.1 hypothetical protein [Celeribacter litoreus]
MEDVKLIKTRLHAGVWEGELHVHGATSAPEIDVTCFGETVEGHSLNQDPDRPHVWLFRFDVPSDSIHDGVQTFLFSDRKSGARLSSLSIMAGDALAEDLRAEIDLLRDELDLLKRAFRRHCLETGAN